MGTWYEYAVIHDTVTVFWHDLDTRAPRQLVLSAAASAAFLRMVQRHEEEVQGHLSTLARNGPQ